VLRVLPVLLVLLFAAAAHAQPALSVAPRGSCAAIVDDRGAALGTDVAWTLRTGTRERQRLDAQCATVGPIVLRRSSRTAESIDTLTLVSWNVHVGGGDVAALVQQLTNGTLTGTPVRHYVLLLQEAFRGGANVPASVADDVKVPRRIAPETRGRAREDIVSLAQRLDLALYYVPSMRNGRGLSPGPHPAREHLGILSPVRGPVSASAPGDAAMGADAQPGAEDRGNAILSTMALEDVTAIELPFTRQRRVAIAASVQVHDADGGTQRLRVTDVHLDALAGASRLWIFASGWRGRQARAVRDALPANVPALLGGDLNTWLWGRWESAYRTFARSMTPIPARVPGESAHGRMDHVFHLLPDPWRAHARRLRERFGSDHRPIVVELCATCG